MSSFDYSTYFEPELNMFFDEDKFCHIPPTYPFDELDSPLVHNDASLSPQSTSSQISNSSMIHYDIDLPSTPSDEDTASNDQEVLAKTYASSWTSFKTKVDPRILQTSSALKDMQQVAPKKIVKDAAAPSSRPPSLYSPSSDQEDSDSDESFHPIAGSRKRQRPNRVLLDRWSDITDSPSASPKPSLSSRAPKRPRMSPPSRNTQSTGDISSQIKDVVRNNAIEKTNFQCPECSWKQTNRRLPDFKRHLKTHIRPSANNHDQGFWCRGVPLDQSAGFLIPPDAKPYTFKGEKWIGGCMRSFSRGDALKRHLDNPNMACISGHL
ncbi:unnamed protein product [Cyclocybe aegerita]|uniref:C2H2-type domain-containing protein n=1 Tax=Cyclocybe aegerita TaxID=1973307 RepID=A0A8S0XNU9_CYCAE|nr:unnamed protein product [Cyclocybe aegerita]